jgi:DNA sulfur modification protein DndD
MLIKRIKAYNFKTYLHLDLNIETDPDLPIVLIGGANGGGKTTFFEAIYSALYGLKIPNAVHFKQLLNAGALGKEEEKILLELHFSGWVLNEEQNYVLTRTYILNPDNKPVESVRLNMNGTIFQYGTATPPAQRLEQEAQVNKIIKANLPQELSHYFLFDAMEAGNLLKEDRLNNVIRENIENVMGFNKFLSLAEASESLFQTYTAQRIDVEKEKEEYLALVEEKKKFEKQLVTIEDQLQTALQYSISHKEIYDNLKAGLNQEKTIHNKVEQLKQQLDNYAEKEKLYRDEADGFTKNFEKHVSLPKLKETLRNEITLILKEDQKREQEKKETVSEQYLFEIVQKAIDYLESKGIVINKIDIGQIVEYVLTNQKSESGKYRYDYFEPAEIRALESLVNTTYINPFLRLKQQKVELEITAELVPKIHKQIEDLESQIAGNDYSLLKAYEENEQKIQDIEKKIKEIKNEINKLDIRIHQFDIQTSQEPDPKYETLKKLKPFFEKVANTLLKSKKEQLEAKMKSDLNKTLAAYRDVIDRVVLSENLKDLSFKIYHKAGNEIYLNHLNTASKQVVVQVLLKALHEYGDYDPPVMIDTVMGVLDETSRATILENYFPELSHQTILLSSDSEIRTEKDLVKIEPFISKAYTLIRDKELQKTTVVEGYFGHLNQH